jgi:hypothetical protein
MLLLRNNMSDDFEELDKIANDNSFSTDRKDARGSKKYIISPMQKLRGFKNRRPRNAQKKVSLVQLKCLEKKE